MTRLPSPIGSEWDLQGPLAVRDRLAIPTSAERTASSRDIAPAQAACIVVILLKHLVVAGEVLAGVPPRFASGNNPRVRHGFFQMLLLDVLAISVLRLALPSSTEARNCARR